MENAKNPHIAIVPSPGMGHLIPLVEFAKRLVHHQNDGVFFTVTFLIPTAGSPCEAQILTLNSLPSSIDHVFLPRVDLSDVPKGTRAETIISLTAARSLSFLRDALKPLVAKRKLVALVSDLFGTDAFDVAKEFDVSPYMFFPTTAMCLSLFLYLPELDRMVTCEYKDLTELVRIPGCKPIHGKELLDPVQDRKNDAYKWVLHHTKRYRLAEGIMVNSFTDLEFGAIQALIENKEPGSNPPVYPVGPLVNVDPSTNKSDEWDCLKWLDDQPHGSVLYVSFGSGGTLSYDQIQELALGLEMSEQRFLWVVRSPNDAVSDAAYFGAKGGQDYNHPSNFLPKGFLERTKGLGLVLLNWAPQAKVLSHASTGGFLTHCGWNSTLESVVNGVPLIVWPLYAEQKMNAVMLTEDIRVALRPKRDNEINGLVCRDEIAMVVKDLMESEKGKAVRNRMNELKEAAAKVLV